MLWRKLLIEKLGGYATSDDAIKAVGGFRTVDEAIEHIRSMQLKEREVVLTLAVKKLFNTVGADDILKPAPGGQWMLEGKLLNKGQVEMLMHEAAQFEQTLLWKVLQKDVLYQVNRKMYLLAENDLQVVTAKFWLYTFDTMKTRLRSMAQGSALFNKKEK